MTLRVCSHYIGRLKNMHDHGGNKIYDFVCGTTSAAFYFFHEKGWTNFTSQCKLTIRALVFITRHELCNDISFYFLFISFLLTYHGAKRRTAIFLH